MSSLRLPVLALAGDADMPDFRLGAEQIADAVPDARMEVLAGAGHLAPLETPDAFWRALSAHLAGGVSRPAP
jgi:3-oxoadipate enol-lactonase